MAMKTPLRIPLLAALTMTLLACTETGPQSVGADADEHGCRASAGYLWCAKTEQCERPWELAEREGFTNEEGAFDAYCGDSLASQP
ncbi:hypothetical protein [Ferrimonas marina]|uniref:Peptidase n=1 Tax=Ferrimonas marina TaxID=299255 RepID=A0A1M5Y098_9GAMM|nr:hypothetical protein [Ferrimonas marina]SHI05254.1 hypothetical protein SAMN02745129_3842 [Ferrimonas marina]